MTSRLLLLFVAASMATAAYSETTAPVAITTTATAVATTSSVYQIVDGRVVFPGWDDRMTTEPEPRLSLTVSDLEDVFVYRERVLLSDSKPRFSKSFTIPADATTFTITARSRQAGDIFPRLRISLATSDNNQHKLFEGYWQTISLETYRWTLSEYVRGREARLKVEHLNPGIVEEERTWYFLRANIY